VAELTSLPLALGIVVIGCVLIALFAGLVGKDCHGWHGSPLRQTGRPSSSGP